MPPAIFILSHSYDCYPYKHSLSHYSINQCKYNIYTTQHNSGNGKTQNSLYTQLEKSWDDVLNVY